MNLSPFYPLTVLKQCFLRSPILPTYPYRDCLIRLDLPRIGIVENTLVGIRNTGLYKILLLFFI
jgi:hypothetical protein